MADLFIRGGTDIEHDMVGGGRGCEFLYIVRQQVITSRYCRLACAAH